MIGEEDQNLSGFRIQIADSTQGPWEIGSSFVQSQLSNLIALDSCGVVYGQRVVSGKACVVLGSCNEERSGSGDLAQSGEIDVASIHDVEGSGLEGEIVEPVDIVFASRTDLLQTAVGPPHHSPHFFS